MADSVVKLRIDSSEYDRNVRGAGQGLVDFMRKAHEAGQSMEQLDDSVMEAVNSIGTMETKSKSARQGMRELSQTIMDLTTEYRQLSDEDKNTDFGRGLSAAIDQLTERAGVMRDAMDDTAASIKNAASDTRTFDQIAGGVQLVTSGFQTAVGAAKLFGVEMGNESEVLATLAAAMSVTNGLQTAQNLLQKQSALMMGVQAAQAAVATAAQTALAAATGSATLAQKAFNLVANMNPYVALATAIGAAGAALYAFVSSSKKAEQATKELNNELANTRIQLQQIDKDTDFSVAIAEASGKSWKAIHELRLEAAYTKLELADMNYDKLVASGKASAEQLKEAADMQQEAWDNIMKINNDASIHYTLERNKPKEQPAVRVGGGRASAAAVAAPAKADTIIPYGSMAYFQNELKEVQQAQSLVTNTAKWKEYQVQIEDVQAQMKALRGETEGLVSEAVLSPLGQMEETLKKLNEALHEAETPEAYQELLSDIKAINDEMDAFTGKNKKGEKTKAKSEEMTLGKAIGSITSSMSSIVGGIEQLGIELPKGFKDVLGGIQAVTSILTGISALVTAIQAITAADAIIPFAHGGIVPHAAGGYIVGGGRFSGDTTPILANAGELVLNRAQQGVLAAELTGGGSETVNAMPFVMGETIVLGVNNHLKRSGQGELVTTQMLRRMGLIG